MRAIKVYFSRKDGIGNDSKERIYCSCNVEVPGLGELEMKDVLSVETMYHIFAEVEEAARIKLNIVKPENKEN